jgi:hypothetical protein
MILGLAIAGAAPTSNPLAPCERSQLSGGVRFKCKGFSADVSDRAGITPQLALDALTGGMKALGDPVVVKTTFDVEGKAWSAVEFTVKRPDGTLLQGKAAATDIPGKLTRVVSCAARGEAARSRPCDAVLPTLAVSGPEPFQVAQVAPSFLGHPVPVPPGCTIHDGSETGFSIGCENVAELQLLRLKASVQGEAFTKTMSDQFLKAQPHSVSEPPRDCQIGGVPAHCRVILAGAPADGARNVFGAAVVNGTPTFVSCLQRTGVQGIHPVCASVISF